jgi:hypothetical protein
VLTGGPRKKFFSNSAANKAGASARQFVGVGIDRFGTLVDPIESQSERLVLVSQIK